MPLSTPTLQFENAAGQVFTQPDGYVLFVYQHGSRQLAEFQALVRRIGEVLRQYDWHRLLIDQRRMLPLSPAENTWLVAFWQQHTRQHRPVYVGVVLAEDVFARLMASQLRQQMQGAGLTYNQFEHEGAAAAWLASVA